MCHFEQQIARRWFEGSSKDSRLYCMKMNNRRIESNESFSFFDSPRDRMNESMRSELSENFSQSLNGSSCSSAAGRLVRPPDDDDDEDSMVVESDDEEMPDSPPDASKRKHALALTPQKDDREIKRQRASPLQSPNGAMAATALLLEAAPPKSARDIRAQFRYQHLMQENNNGISPMEFSAM